MRRPAIVLLVCALGLTAARVAVSSTDHRAPCHSAHSCPSDHHSYVWYDQAGQGWSCAEPGAPEVSASDTQSIYYAGRRYLCRRAGGTQAATCGVAEWSLKTLSDPAALRVDFAPRTTSVDVLRALRRPASVETRLPGAELQAWRIHVRLLWQKLEGDSDVHLVVADPASGRTMIVELPAAGCVGAAAGRRADMSAARAALARYCGAPTTSFAPLHGTATIDGVGFYDREHGQRGAGPNGLELHPVVRFSPGPGRC